MQKHPRVLIVGTIPYNKNTSSRAFDAYFHNWEKENIRQIFSNTKTPVKGHCGSLYQITDHRLLKRRLGKIKEVGVIFEDKDLPEDWTDNDLEVGSGVAVKLYKSGSKKSPFKYLARGWLWKKKLWNTEKLRNWLDEFRPECVFLAFSDDFFIPEIALFVAERYNIPIMSCIGDDYYFNDRFSLSPLYHIYRRKYKKLIRRVFSVKSCAMYIGDKIRDKYNEAFGLSGQTIYLASDIQRKPFAPINLDAPYISYCGNIRLGRNESLAMIGEALRRINPDYRLHVYSAEKNEEYIRPLRECEGIEYHGAVPYSEVMEVFAKSDAVVVVEGFDKRDVNITKYSLSTKAADSLASGAQIFALGSYDCGVIEYLDSVGCVNVCTDPERVEQSLRAMLLDTEAQRRNYELAKEVYESNHNKEKNLLLTEELFRGLIG